MVQHQRWGCILERCPCKADPVKQGGVLMPMDSSITIRKVSVLRGEAYVTAKKVAEDDDLVIVRTTYTKDGAHYEIEKIIGDPVSYLMRE
jgi:hypothetical protein